MDSALPLLGLGFVFGLKHATEADHLVAVSTIVSEHRIDTPVRLLAGTASVLFGLYYAWQTTAGAR